MVTQPDPAESSGLVLSCLGVRRGIGFLSLVLPIVLILGNRWLDGGGIRGSISDYYFTVMRDYFVGTMCARGSFLCPTGKGVKTTTSVMRWPCSPSAWRC